MLLKDFLAELAVSEIRDLGWIDSESSEIASDQLPKVITALNDSLVQLFSLYILKTQVTNLVTTEKKYIYTLQAHDLVQVLDVAVPLADLVLDRSTPITLRIPTKSDLWFSHVVNTNTVPVLYQASHPRLASLPVTSEILQQVVAIPDYLIEPLRCYVAFKIYGNMNGEGNMVKSAQLLERYSNLMLSLESTGMIVRTYLRPQDQLQRNGFV